MATNKEYLQYVLELLREVKGITYKKMMGEYILYKDGVIFGGIYDKRFLIKKSKSLLSYNLKEAIPYTSAKPMYIVDSEDPEEINDLIRVVISDLKK